MSADLVNGEDPLFGLQMVIFSLCLHVTKREHLPGVSNKSMNPSHEGSIFVASFSSVVQLLSRV